ncbi:MAG: hypothetical protein N2572_10235 [Syntrophales bacterium]|nr:hypothetical protein [Syntrophales bacterium]
MEKSLIRFLFVLAVMLPISARGIDSPETRATLAHIQGVHVLIEDYQQNLSKHKKLLTKAGLDKENLLSAVEEKLKNAGLKVLNRDEWLKTPGRPLLCITINTHEAEKYKYAYDVNLQLMQVIMLEANPQLKSMSPTWSLNITGMAHIGNLHIIRDATLTLIDRFTASFKK